MTIKLRSYFHCGEQAKYSDIYDAYYCVKCNIWIDRICGDKHCCYCKDRPEYPKQAKQLNLPFGENNK